jgi:PAS domain S-box-containing protein
LRNFGVVKWHHLMAVASGGALTIALNVWLTVSFPTLTEGWKMESSVELGIWLCAVFVFMEILRRTAKQREENEEFIRVLDKSPNPVIIHHEGIISYLNGAACRLLSGTRDELLGRNVLDFVHPHSQELVRSRIAQGEIAELAEEQWVLPGNRRVDVNVTAVPAHYQGKTSRLIVVRDITYHKRTERTLQERERHYSYLVENAPLGVYIYQGDQLCYANPALLNMLGYTLAEMNEMGIRNLVALDDRALFDELTQTMTSITEVKPFQLRVSTKDNEQIFVEAWLTSTTYEGKPAIIGLCQNVTARDETDRLMRTSETLSVIGSFAAGVAHEIRNPLAAIKGFAQLLGSRDEQSRSYSEIMLAEIERINLLIGEFLSLSKPHVNNYDYVSVEQLVNSVVDFLKIQALMTNIQMETQIADHMDAIYCNAAQVKQVLINIIKNAIEALPRGGTVMVMARQQDAQTVSVCVADDGDGIPPEILDRIGEPFYTTKESGTGLGLMISSRIVEAHGGELAVTSEPGNGTTVSITLPTFNVGAR